MVEDGIESALSSFIGQFLSCVLCTTCIGEGEKLGVSCWGHLKNVSLQSWHVASCTIVNISFPFSGSTFHYKVKDIESTNLISLVSLSFLLAYYVTTCIAEREKIGVN